MNEISLQRKRPHPSKANKNPETNKPVETVRTAPVEVEKPATPTNNLLDIYSKRNAKSDFKKKLIDQWIDSDVLDFLFNHHLHELMPVCDRMNGQALIQLYKMGASHSSQTYALLNDELQSKYNIRLPIAAYTLFLGIMEPLVSQSPPSTPSIKNSSRPQTPPRLPTNFIINDPPIKPHIKDSNLAYDILVNSNLPASQVLKITKRWIDEIPSTKNIQWPVTLNLTKFDE